jgi:hypothetical protein
VTISVILYKTIGFNIISILIYLICLLFLLWFVRIKQKWTMCIQSIEYVRNNFSRYLSLEISNRRVRSLVVKISQISKEVFNSIIKCRNQFGRNEI